LVIVPVPYAAVTSTSHTAPALAMSNTRRSQHVVMVLAAPIRDRRQPDDAVRKAVRRHLRKLNTSVRL
jgi:hypothetical protein